MNEPTDAAYEAPKAEPIGNIRDIKVDYKIDKEHSFTTFTLSLGGNVIAALQVEDSEFYKGTGLRKIIAAVLRGVAPQLLTNRTFGSVTIHQEFKDQNPDGVLAHFSKAMREYGLVNETSVPTHCPHCQQEFVPNFSQHFCPAPSTELNLGNERALQRWVEGRFGELRAMGKKDTDFAALGYCCVFGAMQRFYGKPCPLHPIAIGEWQPSQDTFEFLRP